jgi:hypothetical protein
MICEKKIKVFNKRDKGSLFHYAHFLCDCLFPEIVADIYRYDVIYREKSIDQTIGVFKKIYQDVLDVELVEVESSIFLNIDFELITPPPKDFFLNSESFEKFRKFVFNRYSIDPLLSDPNYPEVLLIKRGPRIQLIDDLNLEKLNFNKSTGAERREIAEIHNLETHLHHMYGDRMKAVFMEGLDFSDQIRLFKNAKLIVLAHGAALSNMFFCSPNASIIEVTCGVNWPFFNAMPQVLGINLYKCRENNLSNILAMLDKHFLP